MSQGEQTFFQCAGAAPVNHADRVQVCEEGIVQVFVEFAEGLIDRLSDQINLGGDMGSLAETRRAPLRLCFAPLALAASSSMRTTSSAETWVRSTPMRTKRRLFLSGRVETMAS